MDWLDAMATKVMLPWLVKESVEDDDDVSSAIGNRIHNSNSALVLSFFFVGGANFDAFFFLLRPETETAATPMFVQIYIQLKLT